MGYTCTDWVKTVQSCYAFTTYGPILQSYPYGGPYMEQEHPMLVVFDVIIEETYKQMGKRAEKGSGKRR